MQREGVFLSFREYCIREGDQWVMVKKMKNNIRSEFFFAPQIGCGGTTYLCTNKSLEASWSL